MQRTTTTAAPADRPDSERVIHASVKAPSPALFLGDSATLANGQVWRQTDAAVLPGVTLEAAPVQIRPARLGGWWLKVGDYNTRARVERVR